MVLPVLYPLPPPFILFPSINPKSTTVAPSPKSNATTTPFLRRGNCPRCNNPSYIFLPHLTADTQQQPHAPDDQSELRGVQNHGRDASHEEEEDDPDPIRSFFQSRDPKPDPSSRQSVSVRSNRRTSWRIIPAAHLEPIPGEADEYPLRDFHQGPQPEHKAPILDAEGGGTVVEILGLTRNLPENTTLDELMGPFAGKVGEEECIELLKRMGEEGLLVPCLYLWEWMRLQRPVLVSPRACSVLFPVLGTAGMGEELAVLFRNLPQERQFQDVHVYNSVITGFASCRRFKDAWNVFEAMELDNVMPNHETCSMMIRLIRKTGGSAKEAWEFFDKMNRKGIEWHSDTVGALVKSFCAEGMKKEALLLQSEMEKKGIPSNVIIYNILMDSYVKSENVEEAEGLLNEMKEKGLMPTKATYNILIDAYSKRMQPEIVEHLLEEMGSLGLKPDVKSYTSLISAYGRQKNMSDVAANAFQRMRKAGIKPTSHSYTALIHAYAVERLHEKAFFAFEDMKRRQISPTVETYTALLDAFRRAGDTEMLMKIWKLMSIDKVEGTRVTFNILVDGFAKQGMYSEARNVIHEFGRLGMAPTVMTYNMLLNACGRGGEHNKMPQVLKEMKALSLKPDSFTYLTMIYAYVRVRDFKRAFFYHKEMVKSGQVPDAASYRKLRAILDVKVATKNRRDRNALRGIINSKMGFLKPKRKKDEFWKNRKRRSTEMHAN